MRVFKELGIVLEDVLTKPKDFIIVSKAYNCIRVAIPYEEGRYRWRALTVGALHAPCDCDYDDISSIRDLLKFSPGELYVFTTAAKFFKWASMQDDIDG